mmetsp:Transcript_26601/g.62491  ORF Transcript_26601/g.62491 Transcript_26601/m.62491 type:complete len:117 (+) Transcript_26601:362-712(+)
MISRAPAAATLLTRAVRSMSSVHRTAEALRKRERTVDDVLRSTVFSPENFPRILTISIAVSTAKFYGSLGWRYYSNRSSRLSRKQQRRSLTVRATTTKLPPPPPADGSLAVAGGGW